MTTWTPPLHRPAALAARLRQERGQALVEFAVVLPVLMLVVMGILYFGRYESYSSQMTQIAESGARTAAVGGSTPSGYTNLAAYVASQATGELVSGSQDAQKLSVRVQCYSAGSTPSAVTTCVRGGTVSVCTQATVQFPFLAVNAGTIFQKATMRVEQTPDASFTTPATGTQNTSGPNPPPTC